GVISRVGDSLRRLSIRRGRKISALVYGAQQLQSVIRNVSRPAWEVDQSDDAETIIHIAAQLGAVADHSTSVPDVVVAIHGPGAHAIAVPHALCFLGGVLSQEPEAVL